MFPRSRLPAVLTVTAGIPAGPWIVGGLPSQAVAVGTARLELGVKVTKANPQADFQEFWKSSGKSSGTVPLS
jgi:hypothetical protein